MASNYNRKSASSGSRRSSTRGRNASGFDRTPRATSRPNRGGANSSYRAIPGGKSSYTRTSYTPTVQSRTSGRTRGTVGQGRSQVTSVRVGDINRADRAARAQRTYRRYLIRFGVLAACVVVLLIGWIALYNSNVFAIENVSVKGVEHLTTAEMEELAGVPEGTTLLRVDTSSIASRLLLDAWVQDVSIHRIFPNTLEIAVTERTIAAVVDVPTQDAKSTQEWAIASDGMWLMPIPDQDSEAGKKTSPQVYEDAAAVLHITDVPYGVGPSVGAYCGDANVNNALAIVDGMTTDLADQVTTVKATETESTTLILDNGIEIVFGAAEDIRDKERVCLEVMEQHPDVVYINVRTVDSPTWRSL